MLPAHISINTRIISILLAVVLMPVGKALGQVQLDLKIDQLTREDGLSNEYVTSIAQDSLGFLWFGTALGLNRYDGYEFRHWQPELGNENSLSHLNVWSVLIDRDGFVWIGTNSGLNKLDPRTNTFTHYFKEEGNEASLSDNLVGHIFEDSEGDLWISTGNGLNRKRRGVETFERYFYYASENPQQTFRVTEDYANNLWIVSSDTLFSLDKTSGAFEAFPRPGDEPGSANAFRRLYAGPDSTLWIADAPGGLYNFSVTERSFTNFWPADPENPEGLCGNRIQDFRTDDQGVLWVGTQSGLCFLDNEGKFSRFEVDDRLEEHFNLSAIWTFFEDIHENVWIGTVYGGVKVIYKNNKHFENYPIYAGRRNSLEIGPFVTYYMSDPGEIWYLEEDRLLSKTLSSGRVKSYKLYASLSELTFSRRENDTHVWIGSIDEGVWLLDEVTGELERITRKNSECENGVRSGYSTGSQFWIGRTYGELCMINLDTGEETLYMLPSATLVDPGAPQVNEFVESIYEDSQGNLWFGTRAGLNLYKPQTNTFELFLSEDRVLTMFEDSAGSLWVGKLNGLFQFDKIAGSFISYQHVSKWLEKPILTIREPQEGVLLISAEGILQYDLATNRVTRYGLSDGLIGDQFYDRLVSMSDEGVIYYGGNKGVVSFSPDGLIENKIAGIPALTRLSVNNEPIGLPSNTQANDESAITEDVVYIDELELAHWQNEIEIQFSSLEFTAPQKNQFRYQLHGYDDAPIEVGATQRVAKYTNLPPGEYVFRLHASNNDGVWSEHPRELRITIRKPWWTTFGALLLYAIALVSILFWINRYFARQIIKRERNKQLVAEANTRALEAKKRAAQLEEVNEAKTRFFEHITHELQNSLTLLITPLKDLVHNRSLQRNDAVLGEVGNLVASSQRLQTLTSQLLKTSKLDAGIERVQLEKVYLNPLLQNVIDSFLGTAEKKEISFVRPNLPNDIVVSADPEKLETILYNLIGNAFKYTDKGGRVSVYVNHTNGLTNIEVRDTGIGISENEIERVFEKYFRSSEAVGASKHGLGIGLSLVQEYTEAMQGQVSVHSELGQGSSFFLKLKTVNLASKKVESKVYSRVNRGSQNGSADSFLVQSGIDETSETSQIVLVEDNTEFRDYLKRQLDTQFDVIVASNGLEGYEAVLENTPALVISDVRMPIMDGITFCTKLKNNSKTQLVPVILMSADTSESYKLQALEYGVDGYIEKPFESRILIGSIHNLIRSRRVFSKIYDKYGLFKLEELPFTSADLEDRQKISSILHASYADPSFTVVEFAQKMHLGQRTLQRRVIRLTGMTPQNLISAFRMEIAVVLLTQRKGSVKMISALVGFRDPKQFSKAFRKHFNMLPSEWISSRYH